MGKEIVQTKDEKKESVEKPDAKVSDKALNEQTKEEQTNILKVLRENRKANLLDKDFGIVTLFDSEMPDQTKVQNQKNNSEQKKESQITSNVQSVDGADASKVETDAALSAKDLKTLFEKNLTRLDADSDGFVSESEIDSAVKDSSYKGSDAKLIAALKTHQGDLEELSDDEIGDENDGITIADINTFDASPSGELSSRITNTMENSTRKLDSYNQNLFSTQNPLDSIKPEAVKQGQIGNCYFMAAAASLASTNPQAIADMIKDNGDGTYTVTFPGAKDEPITVSKPTDAELSRYSTPGELGIWPQILEKAYGKYCNESWTRRSPLSPLQKDIDQEGGEGGSFQNAGLRILTGQSLDSDSMSNTSEEEIDRKLTQAFNDGMPVDCGINNEFGAHPFLKMLDLPTSDNKVDGLGIPAGHEYSVVGYNSESKMVSIRNPWGHEEPTDENGKPRDGINDGIFKVSVQDFQKYFSSVTYTQK